MKKPRIERHIPDERTPLACIECGHRFRKKLGAFTFEVKCPKCGSYDTEPA
jgi:Zn finger protein HypA/HybF involved in hydrogenase expression